MNTTEIVNLLSSNKITRPYFLGCFPIDCLPDVNRFEHVKFSLVVNLDKSTGPGTHWCAIFFNKGKMYYFDSFGRPPSSKYLRKWFRNFVSKVYFNKIKHQDIMSTRCGGFCCWLIFEMSCGSSFSQLVKFLESIDFDDMYIKGFMKNVFNFEMV